VESLSILLNINNGSKTIKHKDYYIIEDVFNHVDCRCETIDVNIYMITSRQLLDFNGTCTFFHFYFHITMVHMMEICHSINNTLLNVLFFHYIHNL
jgi:hypothetical protein